MADDKTPSGLCYLNSYGRHFFLAIQEVMGTNGLNALLHRASLLQYIDNLPPDNQSREFAIAHMTALSIGFFLIFGRLGGSGLAKRTGRAFFQRGFPKPKVRPSLESGVRAMLDYYLSFTGDSMATIENHQDYFIITLEICPLCWNQSPETIPLRLGKADPTPICFGLQGFLQEGLTWLDAESEYQISEVACHAQGDTHCVFRISKTATDQTKFGLS